MRQQVVHAVLALESPFREVVLLRYYEGLCPAAIARRLGVPATLLLSYAMFELNYVGFALARDPRVLIPLTIVKGFGFGLYFASGSRLFP